MDFALCSLMRLRMLYGIESVLVVLGTFCCLVDAVEIDALALVDLVPCIEVVRSCSAYLVVAKGLVLEEFELLVLVLVGIEL